MKLPLSLLVLPAALCVCMEGCTSEDRVVKVESSGGPGVIRRDIDRAHSVADQQSQFQRDGEKLLSGSQ